MRRSLRSDPNLEYLVYVPTAGAIDAPVLVAVHGVSRGWNEQAATFVAHCESHGVVLLAPSFSGEAHGDYQRLGREGRGQRADLFLHRCLQELTSLTGADTTQFRLFGHSGGAQFAHRYLMAYPHRVARAMVAAAGWYTFPDAGLKFPYGIQSSRRLPGIVFNPEAYLRVPVTVLVGSEDVHSKNLRSSERVNAQQGRTRVERARNWVTAMEAQAHLYGIEPQVSLVELPGSGHSFEELCRQGALVERLFRPQFDAPLEGGSEMRALINA
ncbi:MAG: hypothetical protein R6W97_01315 [Thiobacillus sp.]